jgi:ferredoxin
MHHREEPKPREFSDLVVDIFSLVKPHLNIVDAVVGMDGAGPSAGDPKELGFIMAGADGVAVDAAAAYLLGMEPFKVPTTAIAYKRGLGQGDIKNIELTGDVPMVRSDFRWPSLWRYSLIPSSLARAGARLFWIRPMIDPLKCVKCGACVESCPVSALSLSEKIPTFNYRLCINCLCCQEICPEHAISQKKSLLAGLLR